MSLAKLTVIGLYNYDNSLFEGLEIAGLDKKTLVNTILLRSGEFEVVYSNLQFFKNAISLWNDKYSRTFEKWVKAINIDYNPIHNYDKTEEWEDVTTETGNSEDLTHSTGTIRDNTTTNGSSEDVTRSTGDSESLVSAFDATDYQKDAKSINSAESVSNASNVTNINNSKNSDVSETATKLNNNNKNSVRKGRTTGNVGVTTTQEMLESEFNIARWNIYEQIAELFIAEFCIMVY